jgi:hypothetical protein
LSVSKDVGFPAAAERHRAEVSVTLSKRVSFSAKAEITSGGLLAVATLVSSILLSTAVLVSVSTRRARR